jgi:hypothetical protein
VVPTGSGLGPIDQLEVLEVSTCTALIEPAIVLNGFVMKDKPSELRRFVSKLVKTGSVVDMLVALVKLAPLMDAKNRDNKIIISDARPITNFFRDSIHSSPFIKLIVLK